MREPQVALFPLPVAVGANRLGGSTVVPAERCKNCPAPCLADPSTELQTCFRGMNYQRIDAATVAYGFVVHDLPLSSEAHKKELRRARRDSVSSASVARAVSAARRVADVEAEDLDALRAAALNEYRDSGQIATDLRMEISDGVKRAASSAHDLLNLVHTVSANIKAVLETLAPGVPAEKSAESRPHEGAIYFASELMKAKIQTTLLLESPHELHQNRKSVRIHGLLLKYVRIYNSVSEDRGVGIHVVGESYREVVLNPDALGVVVQALLDNAVKYAPHDSEISIFIRETADHVELGVKSMGPKIMPDENTAIFSEFFRGAAAKERVSDGLGFGLAAAMKVSKELRLALEFSQSASPAVGFVGSYATEFRFSIPCGS